MKGIEIEPIYNKNIIKIEDLCIVFNNNIYTVVNEELYKNGTFVLFVDDYNNLPRQNTKELLLSNYDYEFVNIMDFCVRDITIYDSNNIQVTDGILYDGIMCIIEEGIDKLKKNNTLTTNYVDYIIYNGYKITSSALEYY